MSRPGAGITKRVGAGIRGPDGRRTVAARCRLGAATAPGISRRNCRPGQTARAARPGSAVPGPGCCARRTERVVLPEWPGLRGWLDNWPMAEAWLAGCDSAPIDAPKLPAALGLLPAPGDRTDPARPADRQGSAVDLFRDHGPAQARPVSRPRGDLARSGSRSGRRGRPGTAKRLVTANPLAWPNCHRCQDRVLCRHAGTKDASEAAAVSGAGLGLGACSRTGRLR